MAVSRIDIQTFLSFNFQYPVIDVRSEGEYEHARIPGAISMPLFNNEERKVVGTVYKQQSKQEAIKIGLALFGKKMVQMVETVEQILQDQQKDPEKTGAKTVVVHCWRGGMRSGGVAWLLDMYGFKVYTIIGGYKAFRKWGLEQFTKDYNINVIGGYTGSGKTFVLHEIKRLNGTVIDLEDLAKHKGSAFGNIGMPKQPSQEMFENMLALELYKAAQKCYTKVDSSLMTGDSEGENASQGTNNHYETGFATKITASTLNSSIVNNYSSNDIWVEDESQRIGLVNIPTALYNNIRNKPVFFLEVPLEERLKHILSEYGNGDKEELKSAILRIQKRLGGLETKTALNQLDDNMEECFRILLHYYDKQYLKGLHKRERLDQQLIKVECETVDAEKNARLIIAQELDKIHV